MTLLERAARHLAAQRCGFDPNDAYTDVIWERYLPDTITVVTSLRDLGNGSHELKHFWAMCIDAILAQHADQQKPQPEPEQAHEAAAPNS